MTDFISNRPTLDALRALPIGEIAALPTNALALLQEEADAALKSAKTTKDWLDGAIALKFGARANEARAALGKDAGSVRFNDGAVTVVADLPKKVEWDQGRLAALVETIRGSGEDPAQYQLLGPGARLWRLAGRNPSRLRAGPDAQDRQADLPPPPQLTRTIIMFPLSKTETEQPASPFQTLRKAHYGLAALPETIRIPGKPGQDAIDALPILDATLDDVAFALRGLEAEFNALADQMHALRKLSQLARDAGGLGADRAVDIALRVKKVR